MLIRVIDFETTGMPDRDGGSAICEVGYCDVIGELIGPTTGLWHWRVVGTGEASLCNPGRPIPPEIRAVHHISDAEVKDAVSPTALLEQLSQNSPDAFAAHNAKFEQGFFTGGETPWICTYKVAVRLWPDAPSHSNQVLRYWLGMELDAQAAMPPHRAGPDAFVTAHLLVKAFETDRATFDDMVRWSSGPALLPRVTFGKHKGSKWEELPSDYLHWLVDKSDMDGDVKANAKHHLRLRATQPS